MGYTTAPTHLAAVAGTNLAVAVRMLLQVDAASDSKLRATICRTRERESSGFAQHRTNDSCVGREV